jgi:hypothetical protein
MSCPFVAFGIVCGKAGLQAWGGPTLSATSPVSAALGIWALWIKAKWLHSTHMLPSMGISAALRTFVTKEFNHSPVNHHDFKSHHLQQLTYIWNLGIVNSCTQHRRKLTRVLFAVWASNGAFCCHDMISADSWTWVLHCHCCHCRMDRNDTALREPRGEILKLTQTCWRSEVCFGLWLILGNAGYCTFLGFLYCTGPVVGNSSSIQLPLPGCFAHLFRHAFNSLWADILLAPHHHWRV